MIDKFQKLFGPNPPRAKNVQQATLAFEDTVEDIEHKKRIARIKNKRRLLGLLALALLVAVIAPSILSPNDYYADKGAKLEIPKLESNTPAKVVPVSRPKPEAKQTVPSIAVVPTAPASLTSANKVAANAKPAHPTIDEGTFDGNSLVPEAQPQSEVKKPSGVMSKSRVDNTQKTVTVANATKAAAKFDGKTETKAPVKNDTKSSVTAQTKSQAKTSENKPTAASEQSTLPLRASANGRYFIQVIATSNKDAAQKLAQSLIKLGVPAYTEIVHRRGSDLWRVRVGRFMTLEQARRALDILALNSIENGGINQEKPVKANTN